jgi:hypothetical protein
MLYTSSASLQTRYGRFSHFVIQTSASDASPQRVPLRRPCAQGCELHGNCNFEDGRCECASLCYSSLYLAPSLCCPVLHCQIVR